MSIAVAAGTASIAWLLDPAVKTIFIEQNKTMMFLIPIAIVFSFSLKGVSLYFARSILIRISNEVVKTLQMQISSCILKSDINTIESKHSGKYIAHVFYDTSLVSQLVGAGILNLMKDSLTLIVLVALMFYQNWKLGSRMIKIYQKENFELDRSKTKLELRENIQNKIQFILIRATPIMEILTGIMIAGFIYFAGLMIGSGQMEINSFFSFLTAMLLAYQPIRSLATIHMLFNTGALGAGRVFEILDAKPSIKEIDSAPELIIKKGNIKFQEVSFSYPSTEEQAVKNINISIAGGSIAALVGHSGAGKSSIINLLPRFYDPKEGEITIDGQNIKKVTLFSLRKNISMVSQDIILFDDTVRANIAYANMSASEEEIKKACDFAAASDFIKELPNSYETIIGENGVRLSGGQKQRISIARAI